MGDRFKRYVLERGFKITVIDNNVDVLNYKEVEHFDDNKVVVRYDGGIVTVNGYKLIITKMLDDELLINGKIERIDLK